MEYDSNPGASQIVQQINEVTDYDILLFQLTTTFEQWYREARAAGRMLPQIEIANKIQDLSNEPVVDDTDDMAALVFSSPRLLDRVVDPKSFAQYQTALTMLRVALSLQLREDLTGFCETLEGESGE